jgi:hemerythrin-like domain-containing protein
MSAPAKLRTPVVPYREDGAYEWFEQSYLNPHEPLRRFLEELDAAFKADKCGAPGNRAFAKFYLEFAFPFVHEHHNSEEQIFFPWVMSKGEMKDSHTLGHPQLLEKLEGLKTHCEAVSDEASWTAGAKEKWSDLAKYMIPHLNEEEEDIIPLIKQHFSPEEEQEMVGNIMKSLPEKAVPIMLGAILSGVKMYNPKFYEVFVSMGLPPPLREPASKVWMPAYENALVGTIKAIRGEE